MKQTKTKLLCLLIAALMLLSLAACGKETATEPNLIKLGDRERWTLQTTVRKMPRIFGALMKRLCRTA